MAKIKRYPKKPKRSASLKVWENYRDRCKAVDKHNAQVKSELKKKEAIQKKFS